MGIKGINKIRKQTTDLTEVVGESLNGFNDNRERERVYNAVMKQVLNTRENIKKSRRKLQNTDLMKDIYDVIGLVLCKGHLTRTSIRKVLVSIEEETGKPATEEDVLRFYETGKIYDVFGGYSWVIQNKFKHYLMAIGLLRYDRNKIAQIMSAEGVSSRDAIRIESRKRTAKKIKT